MPCESCPERGFGVVVVWLLSVPRTPGPRAGDPDRRKINLKKLRRNEPRLRTAPIPSARALEWSMGAAWAASPNAPSFQTAQSECLGAFANRGRFYRG